MVKISDDIYKQIMWDYNIPKEDVEKLLNGEIERAGHYDINGFALKVFNNLDWYSILKIFTIEQVIELLTDDFIKKIRFQKLQKKYETLRNILRNKTITDTRWYNDANGKTKYPILSDRWYCFE
ncbi:MAG: hypothetical protein JXR68_08685 [Bacteroidales bacterium]|nr:hypothetical protein [Bacteroidales bacterium]